MKNATIKIAKIGITAKGRRRIYWTETKADGDKVQRFFRWGNLPIRKLKRIVGLYNLAAENKRGAKKKLARILGLKFADISFAAFDTSRQVQRRYDPMKNPGDIFQKVLKVIENLKSEHRVEKSYKFARIKSWSDGGRRPPQRRLKLDKWNPMIVGTRKWEMLVEDFEKELPMKEWTASRLEEFLESTFAIKEKITRAEEFFKEAKS